MTILKHPNSSAYATSELVKGSPWKFHVILNGDNGNYAVYNNKHNPNVGET